MAIYIVTYKKLKYIEPDSVERFGFLKLFKRYKYTIDETMFNLATSSASGVQAIKNNIAGVVNKNTIH